VEEASGSRRYGKVLHEILLVCRGFCPDQYYPYCVKGRAVWLVCLETLFEEELCTFR
jgi:hypothetical protein